MVSYTYTLKVTILDELFEIIVSQLACGHLDAYLMQFCKSTSVEMNPMQRNLQRLAKRLTELFIAVRLLAAQAEVAMNGFDAIMQFTEHQQQGHTIGTARQSNEVFPVV